MRVSGVGYSPYIYNTNAISSASMSPVESIEEELLSGGVDYSDFSGENENPLRMGETRNFADIIASQMAMSSRNATRVMSKEDTSSDMKGEDKDTKGWAPDVSEVKSEEVSGKDEPEETLPKMDPVTSKETTLYQRMHAAHAYESMWAS